jgi:hypothetical protein
VSLVIPVGAKIVNDDLGGENEIIECKTAYTLTGGAVLDTTKYSIPNSDIFILPNKTGSSYTITATDMDKVKTISLSAQTVSSLTYTLATPNQPSKTRLLYIDIPSIIGATQTSSIIINGIKHKLGATHEFKWIPSPVNSWRSIQKIDAVPTATLGTIPVFDVNGNLIDSGAKPIVEETVNRYSDLPTPSSTIVNRRYWVRSSNIIQSVSTFDNLPTPSSTNNSQYYEVLNASFSGIIWKRNGIYQSDGSTWNRVSSTVDFVNAPFNSGVKGYKPSLAYQCVNTSGSNYEWQKYQQSISITGVQTLIDNPTNNAIMVCDANGQVKMVLDSNNNPILFRDCYVRPGTLIWFTTLTIPDGYLICNGAAISRSTYYNLFQEIGTTYGAGNGTTTFNIPNPPGMFLRVLDQTKTIDINNVSGSTTPGASARTLGSYQDDDVKSHSHIQWVFRYQQLAPFGNGNRTVPEYPSYQQDASTRDTGGAETRSINMAFPLLIKY